MTPVAPAFGPRPEQIEAHRPNGQRCWAEKDLLGVPGALDPWQVGWVLGSAGAILARNADDLVAPVAGKLTRRWPPV